MNRHTGFAMVLLAAGLHADAAEPVRSPDGAGARREVLAVLPPPAGVPQGYELAIEQCTSGAMMYRGKPACPMTIRLMEGGRAVDRVALEHPACGPAQRFAVDSMFGIAREVRAWMTGGAGCQVGVAVQQVRVAPNEVAVLVTQRTGWEHVSWRHVLYLGQKGKLRAVWSDREENAPNVEVRVLAAPRGDGEDVAVIDVVKQESDELVAERVRARRLHWEPAIGRMVASPLPDSDFPLFLVYVGPFRSLVAAREATGRSHPGCSIPFGVLPAELFPGLGLRGFLRGAVLVSREEANTRKESAGPCPAALTPRIIEYVPKVEYIRRK